MPEFLYSAKRADGSAVTEQISAPSAARAVEMARARGFTDVVLHTDDLTAASRPDGTPAHTRRDISASEQVRFQDKTPLRSFLLICWLCYRRLGLLMLALLGLFIFCRDTGRPFDWGDWLTLSVCISPPIMLLVLRRRFSAYREIQRATVVADWNKVLRLLPALHQLLQKMGPGAAAGEVARYRALALLGLGRREEAFAVVAELEKHPEVPASQRAIIAALLSLELEDYAAAEHGLRKALTANPDHPALLLVLAQFLAFFTDRPQEARAALEQVRSCALAEQTARLLPGIEAAILVAEGRYAEARPMLEQDAEQFRRRSARTPISRSLQYRSEALLVVACARLGDSASARRHFQDCEPYLVAHKSRRFLGMCHAALGGQ